MQQNHPSTAKIIEEIEESAVTEPNTSTTTHAIDMSSIVKTDVDAKLADENICIEANNFNLFYSGAQALKDISLTIPEKRVLRLLDQVVVANLHCYVVLTG